MTEDQNPRSDAERGDGQLLTDTHRQGAPISADGPAGTAAPGHDEGPAVSGPVSPTPPGVTSHAAPKRRRRLSAFLVACGLVIAAAGLTVAVEEQRSRDSRSLVASERERIDRIQAVLTSTDVVTKTATTPAGARVTAVFSAEHISAVLTYRGLPALPAKQTYQIFRVRDDKTKPMRILAAGQLSGTALILGVGNGDALVFTVEPEGGAGQPSHNVAIDLRLSCLRPCRAVAAAGGRLT